MLELHLLPKNGVFGVATLNGAQASSRFSATLRQELKLFVRTSGAWFLSDCLGQCSILRQLCAIVSSLRFSDLMAITGTLMERAVVDAHQYQKLLRSSQSLSGRPACNRLHHCLFKHGMQPGVRRNRSSSIRLSSGS